MYQTHHRSNLSTTKSIAAATYVHPRPAAPFPLSYDQSPGAMVQFVARVSILMPSFEYVYNSFYMMTSGGHCTMYSVCTSLETRVLMWKVVLIATVSSLDPPLRVFASQESSFERFNTQIFEVLSSFGKWNRLSRLWQIHRL